jgi:hypothetical protein
MKEREKIEERKKERRKEGILPRKKGRNWKV